MRIPEDIQAGDILLYSTAGDLVDFAIEVHEGGDVAHVEFAIGNGQSGASRNGIGVSTYPIRVEGLKYILRPVMPDPVLQLHNGLRWLGTVMQEDYDFAGLLANINVNVPGLTASGTPKHLFCSAAATLYLRACIVKAFADDFPAVHIIPYDFRKVPDTALVQVWPERKLTVSIP